MTSEGHDGEKLAEVISVQGEMEAKLIYGILEAEGIRVLVKSNMASGLLPFTADGMGKVSLLVQEDDLDTARTIIEEYRKGLDADEGPEDD
ncbi:MAG TPA: DUF2007 domain-containing protein [Candidatus Krumholzibacterium sp.]|nr:DUF2007 domain-containing protein [Candidatus Krumholzibacterium sp.]